MAEWVWLDGNVVLAVHDEQLAEHGGQAGVRDMTVFDSALASTQQLAACGQPSVAALAACYGYSLLRNHPFLNGNKRTAFVAMELFLVLNGHQLAASDVDCAITMLEMATGNYTESDFAAWVGKHVAPLSDLH